MRAFTQTGWLALQAAIIGGIVWLWAMDTTGDRPPLHVALIGGVFLAYLTTFLAILAVEAVKETRRALSRRRDRQRRLQH